MSHKSQKSRREAAAFSTEQAISGQAVVGLLDAMNPDELVQAKGGGVKIYQDMVRDPYVKAGLQIKKSSLLATPWSIVPASQEPRDMEVAAYFKVVFERMEHSMSKFIESALDALDVGYSLHEKVYDVIDGGQFSGLYGIRRLSSKDPNYYEFKLDEFNRIEKITSKNGGTDNLPLSKFFLFTYQPRYENPYGNSDLRAAYRAFFLKDLIWKFRALYLQRFGMPPVYGLFPPGTSEEKKSKLLKVLKTLMTETAMAIPNDVEIKVLELATLGKQTEYERAIADLNKEILIGILGSFMHVEEGKRVGSRASSREARKVSDLFIHRLATTLQEDIDRQIFHQLGWLNFNVEKFSSFKFEIDEPEDQLSDLEVDRVLVNDLKIPIDPNHFYNKYKRPAPGVPVSQTSTADLNLASASPFMAYVGHRRKKAVSEIGNGDASSMKRAWREILDYCEARDNKNYSTSIAVELARWEVLSAEKLGARPTADEAIMVLEGMLKEKA